MKLLIDLDDVLNNLCEVWIEYLNKKFNYNVKLTDVKDWNLKTVYTSLTDEQISNTLLDISLYDNVKIRDDALHYLPLLAENNEIWIVTNTPQEVSEYKFSKMLYHTFPFIEKENIILTDKKYQISGDILIDDYIYNLERGEYKKFLFTQPHNQDIELPEDIVRVNNWKEIYNLIGEIYG